MNDNNHPVAAENEGEPTPKCGGTEPPPPQPAIALAVEEFIDCIEAVAKALPFSMMMLQGASEVASRRQVKHLDTYGTAFDDGPDEKGYILPQEHAQRARMLRRDVEQLRTARRLFPSTFIINLVSQYDHFVGRLIRCLYGLKPELFNASDRQLTLSELAQFTSIDEAREYVLEKEVETVLRKSHIEQFAWLEAKFNVELRKGLSSWPTFVEMTERRNLFAHADGCVLEHYVLVCQRQGVKLDDNLKRGDRLSVPQPYFHTACSCILEIGVKLSQVLWRKVRPDSTKDADECMMRVMYEALVAEDNDRVVMLGEFYRDTVKRPSSEELRRILLVNEAIAIKRNGGDCCKLLDCNDWSATSPKLRIAIAVLKDDFEHAAELMEIIGTTGEISSQGYHDWPLFYAFRTTAQFADAYLKVFGKPFASAEEIASDNSQSGAEEYHQTYGTEADDSGGDGK